MPPLISPSLPICIFPIEDRTLPHHLILKIGKYINFKLIQILLKGLCCKKSAQLSYDTFYSKTLLKNITSV